MLRGLGAVPADRPPGLQQTQTYSRGAGRGLEQPGALHALKLQEVTGRIACAASCLMHSPLPPAAATSQGLQQNLL
ncbi:hypothetical protein STEG23_030112 [Scotinomys teguina]